MKLQKNSLINLKIDENKLQSMRGSEFAFDYVHLLYYKCHKKNFNPGGSYIDSPDCIERKQQ